MNRAQYLRSPRVLIGVAVMLVVVLVWLFAFFVPQGNKLSKLDAQVTVLSAQQAKLEAQVAELQKTSAAQPELLALQAQMNSQVPDSEQLYPYILTMYNTVKASGLTLLSLTVNGGSGTPGATYVSVPVLVTTTGTYDQGLTFMREITQLPRLTIVDSISLSGGGPSASRNSSLQQTYNMSTFYSQAPAG